MNYVSGASPWDMVRKCERELDYIDKLLEHPHDKIEREALQVIRMACVNEMKWRIKRIKGK